MNRSSNEEQLIELTRELVERPSENPPGDEQAVADFIHQRLQSSPVPFELERYEVEENRPNVIARVGDPSRGRLLLAGHTDVVPARSPDWTGDPYELRVVDGRLIGRGTSDMKGALAATILAAEGCYRDSPDMGEVILAFVVDEEWAGDGSRLMMKRGIKADAAVIGEPTRNRVCIAHKGFIRFRITIRGRSAHSGRPDRGINAIQATRRVLERLERLDRTLRRETTHPYLAPETITATEIRGGDAPNVVPERVSLTLDWRLHPERSNSGDRESELADLLDSCRHLGNPLDWELDTFAFARGIEVSENESIVRAVQAAAREQGLAEDPVGLEATTDARFLVEAGIPTVLFGPGSIEEDAHTVDESVRLADLVTAENVYRSILHSLLT